VSDIMYLLEVIGRYLAILFLGAHF
jgi:hypothetical protein